MHTILEDAGVGRRRRRRHSDEFKASAVAACARSGVSIAAVAMARGINANLLRRWMKAAEIQPPAQIVGSQAVTPAAPKTSFVPIALPAPEAAPTSGIRIELRRGAMSITVTWPVDAASDCAAWMRELLR